MADARSMGLRGSKEPEAREIVDFIETESDARRTFTARAKVAAFAYQDLFHYFVNNDSTYIRVDPSLAHSMIKVPMIRRLVDLATSTGMSERAVFAPVATGDSSMDREREGAVTLVLDEFERRSPGHEINLRVFRNMVNVGIGFKRLYVCDEFVPIVLPPNSLEAYEQFRLRMDGDVRLRNALKMPDGRIRVESYMPVIKQMSVSPFSMLVETGATCLEDSAMFVCHEVRSVRSLKDKYPNAPWDIIEAEAIEDRHTPHNRGYVGGRRGVTGIAGQQTGTTHSNKAGVVRVFDIWMKLRMGWMHMVCATHNLIPLQEVEYPDFHTYEDFPLNRLDENFWPNGLTYGVLDLQRALCKSKTDLQQNFDSMMKDILVVDQRMREKPTNEFGQVLSLTEGMMPPRRVEMPQSTHNVLLSLKMDHEQDMYKAFGLSEVSRGAIQSHVPAEAQRLARQIDSNPILNGRQTFMEGEIRLRQKVVRLSQSPDVYDEPRWIALSRDPDATRYARAIRYIDTIGPTEVKIVETFREAETSGERMERAMQFAGAGLFEPGREGVFRQVLDFVQYNRSPLPEASVEQAERERARAEIEWIIRGEVVPSGMNANEDGTASPGPLIYVGQGGAAAYGSPLLRPTDIHEIHTEEGDRYIRDNALDENALQILMLHQEEHGRALQEIAEQQQREASEAMIQESINSQAGQIALQVIADRLKPGASAQPAPLTPAQGGRISGAVRRGELPPQ